MVTSSERKRFCCLVLKFNPSNTIHAKYCWNFFFFLQCLNDQGANVTCGPKKIKLVLRATSEHFPQHGCTAAWLSVKRWGRYSFAEGKDGYVPPPDLIIHKNRSLSKTPLQTPTHLRDCNKPKRQQMVGIGIYSVSINTAVAPAVGDFLTTAGQPESKHSESKQSKMKSKQILLN